MSFIKPLVTVLMPVFNGEKFLSESIESILSQSFNNFEFLLIDDCSSDKSVQLIKSYNDNRIKLLQNNHNMGQAATMNRGIFEANGEFICRLDQDDVSTLERLEIQVKEMYKNDNTIIGTWAQVINQDSKIIGYVKHPIDNHSIVDSLSINCALTHSSICVRKNHLIKLGGYSLKYNFAMDWELWIRASSNKIKFLNIPDFLVKIRSHPKQATRLNISKLNFDKLSLIRNTESLILTKNNLKAHRIWKFYFNIINTPLKNNFMSYLYNIIRNLASINFFINLFTMIYYHKILSKPDRFYNAPIIYKKLSQYMNK